jgi:hypothetical protein
MPITVMKSSICIYVSDLSWSIAECLKETMIQPRQCNFLAVYRLCPAKSQCLPVARIVELAYCCTIQLYLWVIYPFLAKLQEVTTIFVTSIRMEQLGSHWVYFPEILNWGILKKICQEN